jgi:hypothetical protein
MKRNMIRWFRVATVLAAMAGSVWAQDADALTGDRPEQSAVEVEWASPSEHPRTCSITKAVAVLDGPPTLLLEGSFCEEPKVSVGVAGGELERLVVVASGESYIEANLASWTDPATRLVLVQCPRRKCAIDLTVGAVGPPGPEGPRGPQGPPGTFPQGLATPLRLEVRKATMVAGEQISCATAQCGAGQIVTGGGYLTRGNDALELTTDFEIASAGPYQPYDIGVTGAPAQQWTVCGLGPGILVEVYAVCAETVFPVCGDGTVTTPENCEIDEDCSAFGPEARCDGCNCTNYCGDGLITPPEECDPAWPLGPGLPPEGEGGCGPLLTRCVACECVLDYDPFPGGGD